MKDAVVFSVKDLEGIFNTIKPLKEVQSSELKRVASNTLSEVFPGKIKHRARSYNKGELALFIKDKKVSSAGLSDTDVSRLIEIIPEKIKEEKVVYRAEEKIRFIKLERVKNEFLRIVNQKTDTKKLEEKCQLFFAKNSWILSNILSMPVVFLNGKAYVGGKGCDNKGGKEADFLFRNKLTKNVFIVEIKTPLKKIIDGDAPYRMPNIFSMGKELTGGIVQVLNQRDSLQKEFYSISKGKFKALNPKCVLLIGRLKGLKKEQLESFELFRSNINDCEIITYDELLARTNLVLGQFVDKKKKK